MLPKTVTITVAIKAVTQSVGSGGTVSTGTGVSAGDPLQSRGHDARRPRTVAIAQGVIPASQSPTGYTFLNQQVNITRRPTPRVRRSRRQTTNSAGLHLRDRQSLIPAGQDQQTFQIFRNGVLHARLPGRDDHSGRQSRSVRDDRANGTQRQAHGDHLARQPLEHGDGDAAAATTWWRSNDGAYWWTSRRPLPCRHAGVLSNDFGPDSLTAGLSGTPDGGTVDLSPSGAFTFTPDAGFCGGGQLLV